jgi:hypothetical protein
VPGNALAGRQLPGYVTEQVALWKSCRNHLRAWDRTKRQVKQRVEIVVSISLLGLKFPSPNSKNVCQPMKCFGARAEPRRSSGSRLFSYEGSKIIPKKG